MPTTGVVLKFYTYDPPLNHPIALQLIAIRRHVNFRHSCIIVFNV